MYMGATATRSFQSLGQPNVVAPPATALPRVTGITLRTTGNSNALNCCAICPVPLGVGSGGLAANGIERGSQHERPPPSLPRCLAPVPMTSAPRPARCSHAGAVGTAKAVRLRKAGGRCVWRQPC